MMFTMDITYLQCHISDMIIIAIDMSLLGVTNLPVEAKVEFFIEVKGDHR